MNGAARLDPDVLAGIERKVGAATLREIILLFLEHGPKRLKIACEGGASGDVDSAAAALHSMKSSAGMLGAGGLHELAETMERLARERKTDAVRALLDDLRKTFGEAEQALRDHAARLVP
jgi:HPt (histidine-containing phosphotransfer) domain-containing protein